MKINKSRKINLAILATIAVIVLGIGYAGAAYFWHLPPFKVASKSYAPGEQVTNLQRSDIEKEATKNLENNPDQKLQNEQTDTPQAPSQTTTNGKQAVNVSLTSVGISNGVINASGMVTNLVEEGGVCTYTFTNANQKVAKISTTSTNPTSTTCTRITFSADELPASGTWTVQLSYSSAKAEGVSPNKEITK
jgi:hypothetical protein